MGELEKIRVQVENCQKCGLCKTRTHAVPGEGSPNADIMFIGEGPGKNEDLHGTPFVGAAGKFLDVLLESIGLKRADVFITNVVKCRPPANRDPESNEKIACWPYLVEQIKLIKPKLIVTLGRHAMNIFLPGTKISEIHGQAKRYKGIWQEKQVYFAMYHPAVALYNGSYREILLEDMQKIHKVLEKLDSVE
ncbi:uracil-DNA glycosylase [Patescibacteria group bacterium]|nr:uracil-DNA glycosylase [Patescibacteria group bacterium]